MNVNDLKIELLDVSAVEQILTIEQQVHLSPWSKAKIEACFGNSVSQVLGCLLEQELIAYGILQIIEPEAELQNLAVSKRFQQQGIGSYFLGALIRHFKDLGLSKLMLEVRESNYPAIKLYQANDFKVVGKRKDYYKTTNGGETALLLTREFN